MCDHWYMRYHVSCGECFEHLPGKPERHAIRSWFAQCLGNLYYARCSCYYADSVVIYERLFSFKFSWLFQHFTLLNILFITARRYAERGIATAKLSVRPSVRLSMYEAQYEAYCAIPG